MIEILETACNRKMMRLMLLVFLSALISACVGPSIDVENNTVYEDYSVPENTSDYLIGPEDIIEATFYFELAQNSNEYRIGVGDIIKIEFYLYPELNREETVMPDGLIALPPKGKLEVIGMTRTDLEKKIAERYADLISEPVVTVTLNRFYYALNQLRNAIISENQGQLRRVRVRPDGYVSFPAVKDFRVVGMNLAEMSNRVNQLYQEKYSMNLQVFLSLVEARNNQVYVLGEVRAPSFYPINSTTTLSQVLASSKVSFATAELSTILVISRNGKGKPMAKVIDYGEIIETGNIGKDLVLSQYDIVFVPRTKITKISQIASQITESIPFFRGVGYTFSDQVDLLR
ncbi:MAG: polysaccharide biosynthesis/export family protein [Proteobacteria bacterium]|nr:polysaccharide biosynthesis/export family protein [Pseudomonadota bacterium]MBU1710334.1 polysaccharide biosynthesis/export family protein [Pseudomonadota bacterium]